MLRIHLLQNWFGYSDPAIEEALYEVPPLRRFAGLSLTHGSVPNEATILNFRRLLETHALAPKVLAAINTHLTDHPGSTVHARKSPFFASCPSIHAGSRPEFPKLL